MAGALDGFQRVEVTTRAEWRDWLAKHHRQAESIWLVTYKKGACKPRLPYDDLVEEALAFGWVDSLPRALDAERTMLRLSPRKPGSAWSAANKRRVEKLLAESRMAPPGQAVIDRAKADGSWSAIDAAQALTVPPDLKAALKARPGAAAAFDGFPPSVRRGILEWIGAAKRPETRGRRVVETADKAARGERANQWR